MEAPVTYRGGGYGRTLLLPLVNTVVFVVMAWMVLGGSIWGTAGRPLWFALLVASGATWNLYMNLHRISRDVTFDGRTLRWSAVIGSGAIEVAELTAISSGPLGTAPIRFKSATKRSVLVLGGPGLPELVNGIAASRPDIPIRLSEAQRRSL